MLQKSLICQTLLTRNFRGALDDSDKNHDQKLVLWIGNVNKKHSENADTSTSLTVTCDPDLTSRLRKLMSLDVAYCIVPWYQTFDLHLWLSAYVKVTFTLISRCTLCSCTLVPSMKFVGLIEFEIWTTVCRKLKWRHNDLITYSNLIKFKHKSTKSISKRQTEFHFERT